MTTYSLLLVEDDQDLANLLKDYLDKQGFVVTLCHHGGEAVESILTHQPDLVILDVMLPGKFGTEICREVRDLYHGPIVMFSAMDDDLDQMLGLELGADDYIIKPAQPRLLLSRLRALMRRVDAAKPTHVETSPKATVTSLYSTIHKQRLNINLSTRTAIYSGIKIDLTTAEFELLVLMAQDAGEVIDRETIAQQLRGFDYDKLDRSIDRRISRLRKKLNDHDASLIKTIRGKGYQLCLQA